MDGVQPHFCFQLKPESQAKIKQLVADTQKLSDEINALRESDAHILQPLLERFLHILRDLGDSYLLVEGHVKLKTTSTREG